MAVYQKESALKVDHKNKKFLTIALVILGTTVAWSSLAVAQTGPTSLGNEVPINEMIINEVVIKASRKAQNATSWPGSFFGVGGDELNLIKHRHIAETLVRAPGVWISRGNGQEHLTALRSPVLTGAGACGAFLMAEDNIPLRASGFCNVNQLFESTSEFAERVEVLPGPQSVLYGTNALHGVINVISPSLLQPPGSSLAIEAGSHDYYRTTLRHRGEAKQHHWLFAFNGVSDGAYKDDSGFDQQKFKFRHGTQINTDKGDLRITTTAAFTNLNQETAGFIRSKDAYQRDSRRKENPNPEAYRDASAQRININFDYVLNDGTRWSITPYVRNTDMEFLMHFLPWQPVEKNSHTSIGWQGALQHQLSDKWIIHGGLDGEYTRGKLEEVQGSAFSAAIPMGVHYDYEVNAQVASPFVSLQWQASEALSLSAGLRYEWLSYDYENMASGSSPCAILITCRFARPDDRTDHFNNISWQFGGVYNHSAALSFFTNFSRGYRAPQTTELYRLQQGQLITDLEEETLDSIEIGLRGNHRGWRYSLAAYHMKKQDVIFQDTNRQNISGASTRHKGLDLALGWTTDSNWYASLNASYAKHSYDSDMAISMVDIQGNDIDTAPRMMGSVQLGKTFKNTGKAELEWVYMGSYFSDPENNHSYRGHRLLNFRWQWQATPDWQFGLRINNMLEEDYADRADFGFGQDRYFVGEPRTAFIELSRKL
jgi:outer membrane receptor protein involved in Fe transport